MQSASFGTIILDGQEVATIEQFFKEVIWEDTQFAKFLFSLQINR